MQNNYNASPNLFYSVALAAALLIAMALLIAHLRVEAQTTFWGLWQVLAQAKPSLANPSDVQLLNGIVHAANRVCLLQALQFWLGVATFCFYATLPWMPHLVAPPREKRLPTTG